MPSQQDLTLATLFKAVEDGSFKRVVRRLTVLLTGLNTTLGQVNQASSKLQETTKKASDAMEKEAKSAKKGTEETDKFTGAVNRLARAFKTGATYFIAYRLFHAITAGAKEGMAEIINFDQALHNLAAISDATAGELELMKEKIIETADRTKYSTTEIAEGMVLLTQAGLTAAEATQAVGAVADLAAGTLSNLATASDLVTTTLRAFNIDASETRRVADVMANAINKSKLTVDKLRIAFNYVGTSAHQAGLSLEQTTSTMMMLANAGARASTIGTGMRQVLSRLLSPNKKLREAMAAYGLEVDKSTGTHEWFGKQVEKLAAVMYNFETNTVDMAKAYELFGLRGAQAASILISNYLDLNGVWDKTYQYAMRVGTAQSMMEEQAKGLAFKIKNLTDKMRNFAIAVGDAGLTGILGGLVDTLRWSVSAFTDFANTVAGKAVVNTVLFTSTLWGLITAFKVLRALLPTLKVAMAFLASPAFWGVLAIGLAIGAFTALISHQKKMALEASKVAAANKALVGSFQNYRTQLSNVTEGSDEYFQIVERLKQEHPKYAREIDKVRNSYKELSKALDEIAQKETEESLRRVTEALGDQVLHIQRIYSLYNQYRLLNKENAKSFEDWSKGLKFTNKTHAEAIENVISAYSDLLGKMYKEEGWEAVEAKVRSLIQQYGKYTDALHQTDDTYKKIINQVKVRLAEYEKAETDAAARRERVRLQKLAEISEKLPKEWLKVYNSLSAIEKGYFLNAIESTKNGWANIKKVVDSYKDIIYKGNEAAYEADVKAMEKAYFGEKLSKYFKDQQKRLRDVPDEWKKVYAEASDEIVFELNQAIEKAKSAWNKQLTWFEAHNRKRGESTAAFYIRMDKLRTRFFNKELDEFKAKQIKEENLYEKTLIKINEKYERYTGSKYDKEFESAKKFYNDMEVFIASQPKLKEHAEELSLRNTEAYYNRLERMARLHGFGVEHTRAEFERITGRKTNETYGITSVEKLSQTWRKTGGDLANYLEQLEILKREGKITADEYREAVERSFSDSSKAFTSGWTKGLEKVRSSSEFLYDLAESLPDKIADGFSSAWESWMDGTKSAAESFEDFARGVLKWIAQMITKQLVLNALQGVTGAIGGMGGGAGGLLGTTKFHGGGMVGSEGIKQKISSSLFNFAPRLHDGINNRLKSDEYPAILQKGESVFTKDQMKVLAGAGGTTINVPINIGDSEKSETLKRHLPAAIEDAVLKTMKKYMR